MKKIIRSRFFNKKLLLILLLAFFYPITRRLNLEASQIPEVKIEYLNEFDRFLTATCETCLAGIIQHILLIIIIFITLINRRLLINYFNKISYYTKLFALIFITYEELSFLTFDVNNNFLKSLNNQYEFNLHNAYFMNIYVLEKIPLVGEIGLITVLTSLILFIIGFGSRLKFLNKFRIWFLEKEYSYFSFVYFLNLAISKILNYFSFYWITGGNFFYDLEHIELFLYIVILIDTLDKITIAKKKFFNN